MKKRVVSLDDIPVDDYTGGQKTPLQDLIYEFIKKHPNCTRKDLYSLNPNEGHVRKAITTILKSNKVKETFTIR